MNATTKTNPQTAVAKRIAVEDLKPGDFVTILHEIIQVPSFFWCCSSFTLPADEPVRIRFLPYEAGEPFKVVNICLPFVYAKPSQGKLATFDTRQQQLVRLDPTCGRKVWKQLRNAPKSKQE